MIKNKEVLRPPDREDQQDNPLAPPTEAELGDIAPLAPPVKQELEAISPTAQGEPPETAPLDDLPTPPAEGLDVRFNMRRNQQIRRLRDQVDDLSIKAGEVRKKAEENLVGIPGFAGTLWVPDPEIKRQEQRIIDQRREAEQRLGRLEDTIFEELDTGQGKAASAFNTYMKGLAVPLSESVLKSAGILSAMYARSQPFVPNIPAKQNPLYKAGEKAGEMIRETFPDNPKFQRDFLVRKLPQAFGSGTAYLGIGLLGSPLATAALGGAQIGAEEFDRALERTGDEETAFQAFLLNLPLGATEALPIAHLLRRIDKVGGGAVKNTLKEMAKRTGETSGLQSVEEFMQETFQQFFSNLSANQLYDKTRELFEGVLEGGAAGAIVGAVLGGGTQAASEVAARSEGKKREQVRRAEQFMNELQREFVNAPPSEAEIETVERQPEGGDVIEPVEFGYDPTAPIEDQLQELASERQRLRERLEQTEEGTTEQGDIEVALEQIDILLDEKRSELRAGRQEESEAIPEGIKEQAEEFKQKVVGSAIQMPEPSLKTFVGRTHADAIQKAVDAGLATWEEIESGEIQINSDLFLTGTGEIISREEAAEITDDRLVDHTNIDDNIREQAQRLVSSGIEVDEKVQEALDVRSREETETEEAGVEGIIGQPVFNKGLAIAVRNPDGTIFAGQTSHAELINEFDNIIDVGQAEMGFLDEQGDFLTREEAAQRVNELEDVTEPLRNDRLFGEDIFDAQTAEAEVLGGRYTVRRDQTGLVVRNNETREEVGRRSSNYSDAVAEFVLKESRTLEEFIDDTQLNTLPEYLQAVAQASNNPLEVAQAYNLARSEEVMEEEASSREVIQQFFEGGGKIRPKDFDEYLDPNLRHDAPPEFNFLLNKNATSLDVQAEILSEQAGREIEPQDIADYLINNFFEQRGGRRVSDHISDRFEELTGITLTDNLAESIENASLEEFYNDEGDLIAGIEFFLQEYFDDEGNINHQKLWNEALSDDQRKEFFTGGFPLSLTEQEYQQLKSEVQNAIQPGTGQAPETTQTQTASREGQTEGSEIGQPRQNEAEKIENAPPSEPPKPPDDGDPPGITPREGSEDLFEGGFDEISDNIFDRIRFQLQDRLIDLKRFQDAAEKQRGTLSDAMDAYMKEELFSGRVKEAIDEFEVQYEDAILAQIEDMGWTLEQAEQYLVARHAKERNDQIARINPEIPEGGSGMTTQEAKDILSQVRESDEAEAAEELGRLWDDMMRFQREMLVDSGLISEETKRAWEDVYDHYISLKGDREGTSLSDVDIGKGFDISGGFKRATGRTTPAENAIANTLAQVRADIVRAEKAVVGQALLRFVRENPNENLWTIDRVDYSPTINRKTGLVEYKPNPRFKLRDNVLNVRVNGVDHHIEFKTDRGKRLAKALKNVGHDNAGVIVKGLYTINRYLALVNTGLNPEFVISNFFRDIQTAGLNLGSTEAAEIKTRILKDVFKARRGMMEFLKGQDTDNEWRRMAELFSKVGGRTGWIDAYKEIDAFTKELQSRLNRLGRKKGDPRELARTFFEGIIRQNEAVENAIRLSAFKHARDLGLSDERAASLAKNLTVNFNRRGNISPTLNAMYLFYGASVQGTIRIFQAVKSPRVRKMVGGAFIGLVAMDIINRIAGGEDDDNIAHYDKIPQWIKDRNLIFMLPETEGEYITIPAPYGYNVVNVAAQETSKAISSVYDWAGGFAGDRIAPVEYRPGQSAINIIASMLDAFNPVGSGGSMLQVISNTAIDPFVQTGQNIDWTGRPIKPPSNVFDLTPPPESQQFFESAPEWAKWSSKQVNELTGGTPVEPGAISISPEYLEHWYRFIGGGAGNFVDESVDAVVKSIRGEQLEPYRIPFAGKLWGSMNKYNTQSKFLEYRKKIEYAKENLEYYQDTGDDERVNEITTDREIWLNHVGFLNQVQSEIRKLSRDRSDIQRNKEIPRREKLDQIKEIEQEITSLQQELIKSVVESIQQEAKNE